MTAYRDLRGLAACGSADSIHTGRGLRFGRASADRDLGDTGQGLALEQSARTDPPDEEAYPT